MQSNSKKDQNGYWSRESVLHPSREGAVSDRTRQRSGRTASRMGGGVRRDDRAPSSVRMVRRRRVTPRGSHQRNRRISRDQIGRVKSDGRNRHGRLL